jgi:hypothetical protein
MFLSEWVTMLASSTPGSDQQIAAAGALLTFTQQRTGCLQLLAGGVPAFATLLRQHVLSTDASSKNSSSSADNSAVSTSTTQQPTISSTDASGNNSSNGHIDASTSSSSTAVQQSAGCEEVRRTLQQQLHVSTANATGNITSSSSSSNPEAATSSRSSNPAIQQPAGCDGVHSALQRTAATALQRMMQEHPPCSQDVVAAGAVPLLAALLRQPVNTPATQQAAAAALDTLCAAAAAAEGGDSSISPGLAALAQAGVIVPAVQLMETSTNPATQAAAAAMLAHLSASNEACRTQAVEEGAISAALKSLRKPPSRTPSLVMQEKVLAFLNVMVNAQAGAARALREAGGVPQLVQLLGSPSTAVQANAAQVLHTLTAKSSRACGDIAAGGIPALVQVLGGCSSNGKLLAHAVGVLSACMASSRDSIAAACRAGAVPVLVKLLGYYGTVTVSRTTSVDASSVDIVERAVAALRVACQAPGNIGQEACVQLRESGGLGQLVSSLTSDSVLEGFYPSVVAILAAAGRVDMQSRGAMRCAGACFALELFASHFQDDWEEAEFSNIMEALSYVNGSAPVLKKLNHT